VEGTRFLAQAAYVEGKREQCKEGLKGTYHGEAPDTLENAIIDPHGFYRHLFQKGHRANSFLINKIFEFRFQLQCKKAPYFRQVKKKFRGG
jgi:hypothetical protein